MTAILKEYRAPKQLVEIIKGLYTGTRCQTRTEGGVSKVNTGVRQGCALSPFLFNCFLNKISKEASDTHGGDLNIQYTTKGGVFLSYCDKTPAVACI